MKYGYVRKKGMLILEGFDKELLGWAGNWLTKEYTIMLIVYIRYLNTSDILRSLNHFFNEKNNV